MEEDLNELVTCSVCLERFDLVVRPPKALPCQHVICLVCANSMLDQSGSEGDLECPQCRQVVRIALRRANSLPDCIHIKHLMDVQKREQERQRQKAIREELRDDLEAMEQLTADLEGHLNRQKTAMQQLRRRVETQKQLVEAEVERCIERIRSKGKSLVEDLTRKFTHQEAERVPVLERSIKLLTHLKLAAESLLERNAVSEEELANYCDERDQSSLPDGPSVPEWTDGGDVMTANLSCIARSVSEDIITGDTADTPPGIGEAKMSYSLGASLVHARHAQRPQGEAAAKCRVETLPVHLGMAVLPQGRIALPTNDCIRVFDCKTWKPAPHFKTRDGPRIKMAIGYAASVVKATSSGILVIQRDSDILLLHPDGRRVVIETTCCALDTDGDSNLIFTLKVDTSGQRLTLTSYDESGTKCEDKTLPLPVRVVPGNRVTTRLATDAGSTFMLLKRSIYRLVDGRFVRVVNHVSSPKDGVRGFVCHRQKLFVADAYASQVWVYDMDGVLLRYVDLENTALDRVKGLLGVFVTKTIRISDEHYQLVIRRPAF